MRKEKIRWMSVIRIAYHADSKLEPGFVEEKNDFRSKFEFSSKTKTILNKFLDRKPIIIFLNLLDEGLWLLLDCRTPMAKDKVSHRRQSSIQATTGLQSIHGAKTEFLIDSLPSSYYWTTEYAWRYKVSHKCCLTSRLLLGYRTCIALRLKSFSKQSSISTTGLQINIDLEAKSLVQEQV
ncbi:hypothetical protein AVEN_266333-1 [Araneus ventricosus]|uniref:Uncharacterized protein n=1 Tax=Araneus ventricosus TaxID=182803 RepID=A0A4Y2U8S6_ARAVE|nr:hypothetical protein AVEN_266333-1 [Araneus ventricosus]